MDKNIFQNLVFCHPWRPEQQRVLDRLQEYLDDKRIHIVAAPGAGKTVIGLEVFKRLQLKTLAISPTTVVRNQWLERLNQFLPDNAHNPDWAGTLLRNPSAFTASTYQGLFSFDKKLSGVKEEDTDAQYESLSHWFMQHEIRLLILDEAHHLKAAWWKILMKLVNASSELIIVSLTATPPYDASPVEWSRYQQLCGPVDEEISIPELVRSNSLCPHQDYIWMVKTDDKNISSLNRQKKNLCKFIDSLENHAELFYLLQLHHWLDEERTLSTKEVLINLDECFALLGLLKVQKEPLPQHLLTILQTNTDDIQRIDVLGWEVLLQGFLTGDHYPAAKPITAFKETLASLLKSKYFLKYNRVSLDNSKKKLAAFSKTQERIKACFDIANVEYQFRENWMRLVILSDFIRDEKYQLALDGLEVPTGAYPIFHYFIHHLDTELAKKTVLLTGRLSIIHQDLIGKLSDHLPPMLALSTLPYSENTDYVVLKVASEHLSAAFTKLHKDADVLILIGTRSLLGEGWDAPHVNALILATQTGAYVTTNQIRGRAIRIDPEDELKTASIWHIVAVAPNQPFNKLILNDLHKRFKTFAGIHASELSIESGIERLALSVDEMERTVNENELAEVSVAEPKGMIEQSNEATIQRLQDDIYNLQARWQNALEKTENHTFQSGLQVELSNSKKWQAQSHYVANVGKTFKGKKSEGVGGFIGIFIGGSIIMFALIALFDSSVDVEILLIAAGVVITLGSLGLFAELFYKQEKTSKPNSVSSVSFPLKFATVILSSLRQIKAIGNKEGKVSMTEVAAGYLRFSLSKGNRKENEVFLSALSQLLEPIRQPRYIIALVTTPKADDIISVPHVLGAKKEYAEIFLQTWQQYFPEYSQARLLSTQSEEGQQGLLSAKIADYKDPEAINIRLIDRWE